MKTIEFRGKNYNAQHGSPFDRGSADSWYHRPAEPHWYPAGTGFGTCIEAADMTAEQLEDYHAGYAYNEQFGGKKDYE